MFYIVSRIARAIVIKLWPYAWGEKASRVSFHLTQIAEALERIEVTGPALAHRPISYLLDEAREKAAIRTENSDDQRYILTIANCTVRKINALDRNDPLESMIRELKRFGEQLRNTAQWWKELEKLPPERVKDEFIHSKFVNLSGNYRFELGKALIELEAWSFLLAHAAQEHEEDHPLWGQLFISKTLLRESWAGCEMLLMRAVGARRE